jgi:GNAT superfamily N-acetyltransferase
LFVPITDSQLFFSPMAQPPSKKVLQAFHQEAGWSQSRREVENLLKAERRLQWVSVELDNVKIGIVRLELAPPEFCYISDLIIKSKYRRQGVGRWLVQNIEGYCSRLGIRRMLLLPEAGSRPFYEALSFVPDPFVSGVLKKEINPLQPKMLFTRGGKGF